MRTFIVTRVVLALFGLSVPAHSIDDAASRQTYERRKADNEKRLAREQAAKNHAEKPIRHLPPSTLSPRKILPRIVRPDSKKASRPS